MKPWLCVVGIGEDGLAGLAPGARLALDEAGLVVGGARHLELAGIVPIRALVWPQPLEGAFPQIAARRGTPVCVLASGDPLFYGVGSTLLRSFAREEMHFLPGLSSFSLAAARLGWPIQDTTLLSLHGRSLERLIPALQPGTRILALSWDQTTPRRVADLLVQHGFSDTLMTVCECINGPRERIRTGVAQTFQMDAIDPLNLVALDIPRSSQGRALPLAAGLDDALFEHDGQITRSDMRAVTVGALRPHPGQLLWDIGAGSGSISIEWMLRHPSLRAIAVESNATRVARIKRNADALGVPDLDIINGTAPEALAALAAPDAIFIGGGAHAPGMIETVWERLKPGGRLVINAVTLETQALLARAQAEHGGELVQVQLARAEPVGRYHGWRVAMPVVQWRITKPLVQHMQMHQQPQWALGLGYQNGVQVEMIMAAIRATLALPEAAPSRGQTVRLFTLASKAQDVALLEAARQLDLRLEGLDAAELRRFAAGVRHHSPRIEALYGVGSVAEAAALAGAGQGSRLVVPRHTHGGVTSALAQANVEPAT